MLQTTIAVRFISFKAPIQDQLITVIVAKESSRDARELLAVLDFKCCSGFFDGARFFIPQPRLTFQRVTAVDWQCSILMHGFARGLYLFHFKDIGLHKVPQHLLIAISKCWSWWLPCVHQAQICSSDTSCDAEDFDQALVPVPYNPDWYGSLTSQKAREAKERFFPVYRYIETVIYQEEELKNRGLSSLAPVPHVNVVAELFRLSKKRLWMPSFLTAKASSEGNGFVP